MALHTTSGFLSACIAAVIAVSCSSASAQEAAQGTELTSELHLAVGAALTKAAYQKAATEPGLVQLQKEISLLEGAINSGKTLRSDSLVVSLQTSTMALKDIRLKLNEEGSVERVRELTEDIRLKNAATTETFRLFGMAKPTPEVEVRVNVLKQLVRQSGYAVILVPAGIGTERAWKDGVLVAIPLGSGVASQFTPNAIARVLPGVYWVQIHNPKLVVSRLLPVGLETKEIDVKLP